MVDTKNISLTFNKKDWKPSRLGEVVEQVRESSKNPREENIRHVVGLEHIDPDDIHLRNSSELDDSTSFSRKFQKGDILFGRRRAYLKKAAVAEFSGICSGDIIVMRAKDKILPSFLPFLIKNDAFFDYAIKHSAGGLSPRVKFKDLANYQFLLPPKEEQAKIAELLWALDEVIERDIALINSIDFAYQTYVDDYFSKKRKDWNAIKLESISKINQESLGSKTPKNFKFKYLDISSILEPKVLGELSEIEFSEAPSRARRVVRDNSIILSMVRPYHKSFVKIKNGKNIIASTGTSIVDIYDPDLSNLVFHQFFSKRFTVYCENLMTGTNYPAITPSDLKHFEIYIPKNNQTIPEIIKILKDIEFSKMKAKTFKENSRILQKSLINQIFS